MKTLIFLAVAALGAFAQQPTYTVPPPPSPAITVTSVGVQGFNQYNYMVVAHYPGGAAQSNVFSVYTGNATLSGSNYNQIGWPALPGALNYDVLRLPTTSFTGTCTCSLTTAASATTYSDTGGSLSSYTIGAPVASATVTYVTDNTDYAFPKQRILIGTNPGTIANHLAEIPSGTVLPTYASAGDLFIEDTGGTSPGCYIALVAIPSGSWTSCGSSGGSAVVPATDCGTSAGACVPTVLPTLKIVKGIAAATSASPSTVAITGMPAFASTTSYACYAEDATTAANVFQVLTAGYVSTTAVTFTGPNTVTDTIRWTCIGS
jgi:hypothetical protein